MIIKKTLKNNLDLILAPIPSSRTTTVLFMVSTGSKYEHRKNNGISHFLEHMFFKGTSNRPNTLVLTSELDRVGGEYNAFTNKEYTGYWIKTSSNHLNLSLDVLSDMLINSKFDKDEINREKGVIIEEYNMYMDSPRDLAEDVFEDCLYGDTPAGWSIIGTKENITNFERQDFLDYFCSQYNSKNSSLIISGKIPQEIEKIVSKYFSKFPEGESLPKLEVKENQVEPKLKIYNKKTDQAHLMLGVRTLPYGNNYEFILKALSAILGGSMSSRLFIELRERNGLAYYIRTTNENYSDCGYLATRAGVPVDKVELALKIILKEYKRISEELVDDHELSKIKQFLEGRINLQLEASDDLAQWYAFQAATLKQQKKPRKILKPEDFLKKIKEVKASDIKEMASKIFRPENLNLAIVGPYKNEDDFKKIIKSF